MQPRLFCILDITAVAEHVCIRAAPGCLVQDRNQNDVKTANASSLSSEKDDLQATRRATADLHHMLYSSSDDQQAPPRASCADERVDREVPFYPAPTLPCLPLSISPQSQVSNHQPNSAVRLHLSAKRPSTPHDKGPREPLDHPCSLPGSSLFLVFFFFFLFFCSTVSSVAHKEKAVVLENPAAAHRTKSASAYHTIS